MTPPPPAGEERAPRESQANAGIWGSRAAAYAGSAVHARGASLQRLVDLLAPRPGEAALDVGCGAGHAGGALAARGCAVTAVDPDAEMLAAATDAYPALRPHRASAGATGLPAGTFDLACARHTLHHHDDPDATLREVRRLLRPGGRFVLVDESALAGDAASWYEDLERTRDPDHRSLRTAEGWEAALARAGFDAISADARTTERIEIEPWLDRVHATEARRDRVHALFRTAPREAQGAHRPERDEDGTVIAFAMPMVVAYAERPYDPTPEEAGP